MNNKILDGLSSLNLCYDILVIGESGVGKTSLVQRYVNGVFSESEYDSSERLFIKYVENTTLASVSSINSTNGPGHNVSILDSLPLVDTYGSSRRQQVRNARTIMYVFSLTDRESFEALEYLVGTVKTFCDDDVPPFVIVATHCDAFDHYQVESSEGMELAQRSGALGYFETSASADIKVSEAFAPLVDLALELRQNGDHLEPALVAAKMPESDSLTDSTLGESNSNSSSSKDSRQQRTHGSEKKQHSNQHDSQAAPNSSSSKTQIKSTSTHVEKPQTVFDPAASESSISTGPQPASASIKHNRQRSSLSNTEKPSDLSTKEKSGCCIIV